MSRLVSSFEIEVWGWMGSIVLLLMQHNSYPLRQHKPKLTIDEGIPFYMSHNECCATIYEYTLIYQRILYINHL